MAPLYNLEMYSKAIENNNFLYVVGSGTGSFRNRLDFAIFSSYGLFLGYNQG